MVLHPYVRNSLHIIFEKSINLFFLKFFFLYINFGVYFKKIKIKINNNSAVYFKVLKKAFKALCCYLLPHVHKYFSLFMPFTLKFNAYSCFQSFEGLCKVFL